MDLRSLRYFTEIADTGSISAAAIRVRRSQPTLSRSIHELEAELGLKLFERAGRRIVITSGGSALLERIRPLLRDVDGIADQARLLASGRTAVIRLGGSANSVERVIPEILRRFRVSHPHVEVRIRPEGGSVLLGALETGDIDVAITRFTTGAFLDAEPAFPLYALAALPRSHRLSRRKSVSITDLEAERLLVSPSSITSRKLLELAFQGRGMRPRIALESHEVNSLLALAEAEQGIAVVPSTMDTRGRSIVLVPILDGRRPLGAWMAAVWNRHRRRPDHVVAFIEQACRHLRSHYPGKHLRLPLPERPAALEGTGCADLGATRRGNRQAIRDDR